MATPVASGELAASQEWQRDRVTQSEQTIGLYHELWKKVRGNHAWSVDGRDLDKGRLAGPVFDAKIAPRLTVVDERSENAQANDLAKNLNPVAGVKIRCLREDIDVYDIEYKDPNKQKLFQTKSYREVKLATAREVLKEAILREGLVAGDLVSDPYAEMTICDVSITIIDSSS